MGVVNKKALRVSLRLRQQGMRYSQEEAFGYLFVRKSFQEMVYEFLIGNFRSLDDAWP